MKRLRQNEYLKCDASLAYTAMSLLRERQRSGGGRKGEMGEREWGGRERERSRKKY